MSSVLQRSSFKYLLKHPWQFVLSIIGIAIGVAVIVSVDLANQSAEKAFKISMNAVAGKATHYIVGTSDGFNDSVYTNLRVDEGLNKIAPVIEEQVKFKSRDAKMTLLGVDVFAERPFRDYLSGLSTDFQEKIAPLLTIKNAAIISSVSAEKYNIRPSQEIIIEIRGIEKSLNIIGTFNPANEYSKNAASNLIITDISSAQTLLNMGNNISRIDMILPEGNKAEVLQDEISNSLPEGLSLLRSSARNETTNQMTSAFKTNLTAMSLLALIVGMFLIFNTMMFSVIQRRRLIGLLRLIGVARSQIFNMIILEAILYGLIGTAAGLLLGILLGTQLVKLITQTINDLYFVVNVSEYSISAPVIAKGVAVGLLATIISSLKPAKDATTTQPNIVVKRSSTESSIKRSFYKITIYAFILIAFGAVIFIIPSQSVIISYLGVLPVIIGFALLSPLVILLFIKLVNKPFKKIFGLTGKMAVQGINSQMSRTAVAISALSISIAAAIGVGTMINSFRTTVVSWLENRLEADLYISSPNLVARKNTPSIDFSFADKISELQEVNSINYYRRFEIADEKKNLNIIAAKISEESRGSFLIKSQISSDPWEDFDEGDAIFVSEPFAYKHDIDAGDDFVIPTPLGKREFKIAAVYYDYASDIGLITLPFEVYNNLWEEKRLSGISVFASKGITLNNLKGQIESLFPADQEVLVRSNRKLRESSIEVFDRTFIVAEVLQLLAVIVSFIGILSALLAIQLEKSREFGVLRANGLTPKQLRKLINYQTGVMGLIAGLLAVPLGNVLALILIYIINKRSFGWTLQFDFEPQIILQGLILALVAAILAGIYPGWKISKTSPALALRDE